MGDGGGERKKRRMIWKVTVVSSSVGRKASDGQVDDDGHGALFFLFVFIH